MAILSQSLIESIQSSNKTITLELAKHPKLSVHDVADKLYGSGKLSKILHNSSPNQSIKLYGNEITQEELDFVSPVPFDHIAYLCSAREWKLIACCLSLLRLLHSANSQPALLTCS